MNDIVRLGDVEKLKALMLELPQADVCETEHLFADGMYGRIMFIPADTMIVGKKHKKAHFFIVLKGKLRVGHDTLDAGTVVVSKAGTQRAIYAIEDSLCMNVHKTKYRNVDKIERQLIEPDPSAAFDARNKPKGTPCLGSPPQQ